MEYSEDDFLQLSGLQRFAFCRREFALTHIENQWAENYNTVDGNFFHERAHDATLSEK
ncbi:MAG: Dna2/Cas4 domain-containing protein, partial [Oscillospiraceae bacterium]